jgi:ribosomal protein S18 acetylase RimI-like enzyme
VHPSCQTLGVFTTHPVSPVHIRSASASDTQPMWTILREVAEAGDTIPTCASANKASMVTEWLSEESKAFMAVEAEAVVGMYKLGANQPDLGGHVATATFMVAVSHRRSGVGTGLIEHCLRQAIAAGFESIQFNFVVSSNVTALSLYKKLGFSVAGTLPRAFRHSTLGFIDAHVLFKALQPEDA